METVIGWCKNLFLPHHQIAPIPARNVVIIDSEDDDLPLERIRCAHLRRIGEAWLRMDRQDGEALPRWSAFDPARFTSMLDKFCVLRAWDWRADEIEFSLYGGHATDFIGHGKPLILQTLRKDPLLSENYIDIRNRAGRSIDNKAPQYVHKTLSWNGESHTKYEVLMLPFMPQENGQRILQPVSVLSRKP